MTDKPHDRSPMPFLDNQTAFLLGQIDGKLNGLVNDMTEVKESVRGIPDVYATKELVDSKLEPMKKWYYAVVGAIAFSLIAGGIALLFSRGGP